jgi:heme/copper-type cytochrome/quinol oxidase subunit 2
MYCSTCGVAVTTGLSYCNYCGAKLNAAKDEIDDSYTEVKPGLLVSAMTALFIFGLVAIIMMMGMMKVIMQLPVERVLAFALVPFLIMLVLEGVFMRLLFRSRRRDDSVDGVQLKGSATRELDAAHARALPEPKASVTEHTTRAFDPIYTEQRSKETS